MGIQLSFLALLVSIAVASTRLIYHDGVSRQFSRMGTHCRMLAALIIVTSVYSASIGFSIHEQCMREIQQKESQIKALAQQKFADDVDRAGKVILTTVAGNKICIGDDDGLRNGAGDSGRGFGELRRSDLARGDSQSGRRIYPDDEVVCDGSGDDGLLDRSELLGKLRQWSDGCFSGSRRIIPADRSVSF